MTGEPEPRVSIEAIRQPLTAILGRLDLIDSTHGKEIARSPTTLWVDLFAIRVAALNLNEVCRAAEREQDGSEIGGAT